MSSSILVPCDVEPHVDSDCLLAFRWHLLHRTIYEKYPWSSAATCSYLSVNLHDDAHIKQQSQTQNRAQMSMNNSTQMGGIPRKQPMYCYAAPASMNHNVSLEGFMFLAARRTRATALSVPMQPGIDIVSRVLRKLVYEVGT